MYRNDLVLEVVGQVEDAHAGVVGADHRIGPQALELPGHGQSPLRIGPVVGLHQLDRASQNSALEIQLLSCQFGAAPHVAPIGFLGAAQRGLQTNHDRLLIGRQATTV